VEETDMEDGVDGQGCGQLEFVGDGGDLGTDGIGTNEVGLELSSGALCLGGEVDVRRGEEDFVTYRKGDVAMVLVSIFLLVGLGQDKGISSLLDGILMLAVEVCGCRDGVRECGDLGVGVDRISAVAEAEWGHLGGGVWGIVAGKLGGR
jgi:hypothetical protein